jgi:coniferyl-aldehyde dehydrogenase
VRERGGKPPAVIDPNYPLQKAVDRIMFVKQFNAGQICTNVDYTFVHESQVNEFVALAQNYVSEHCPDIEHIDYTSVIDDKSFVRLQDTLTDARDKGAQVINLSPNQEANSKSRKFPMHIVLDTTEDMIIRQRETFGPILMVIPYKKTEEVLDYINAHDRPLAFYPFSNDKKLVQHYIDNTMSGGVTVNDALFHVAQHDLPFGGVGPSGMGHYHGYDGFIACSKLRPVFYQANVNAMKMMAPPYGKRADQIFNFLLKLKK